MKSRQESDEPLWEIAVTCVENMSTGGWQEFTSNSMDEMDEDDFLEAVANTDHKDLIRNEDEDIGRLSQLKILISQWHEDRKITINGNAGTQLIKLGEEYGELCHAHVRNDIPKIKDAIGDMFVVMVALSELHSLDISDCVDSAYDEIKDRRGSLNEQGNFIKEET